MIRLEFVGGLTVYWDETKETLEAAVKRAYSLKHGVRTAAELVPTATAQELSTVEELKDI